MITLYFDHAHGRYVRNDIATWENANDLVKSALTPQWRVVAGRKVQKAAARVISSEEAARILAERRKQQDEARAAKRQDPGVSLLFLTAHDGGDVGHVEHFSTDAAAELLQLRGPYFDDGGIQIGEGPVCRPATEREKQMDHRARIEKLLEEREEDDA